MKATNSVPVNSVENVIVIYFLKCKLTACIRAGSANVCGEEDMRRGRIKVKV